MEKKNMSFLKAVLLLIPIVLYIASYVGINNLLGLKEVWLGFVVFWYWGMEKGANVEILIKSIFPGALVGVGISYLLQTLPNTLGTTGIVIIAVLVSMAVICTLTGWFKNFVNGSTFLLMTILSIPMVSHEANHFEYIQVIVVACTFIFISSSLMKKLPRKKTENESRVDMV